MVQGAAVDCVSACPAGDRGLFGHHLPDRVEHVHLATDCGHQRSAQGRPRCPRTAGPQLLQHHPAECRSGSRRVECAACGDRLLVGPAMVRQRCRGNWPRVTGPATLTYSDGDHWLRVEPWGPDSVRVRAGRTADVLEVPGALLDRPAEADGVVLETAPGGSVLMNGALRVELSLDGLLRFVRVSDGEELLAEAP